jgi:hypothetical protein
MYDGTLRNRLALVSALQVLTDADEEDTEELVLALAMPR